MRYAGIHRSRERHSDRQAARRGSLSVPTLPAGCRDARLLHHGPGHDPMSDPDSRGIRQVDTSWRGAFRVQWLRTSVLMRSTRVPACRDMPEIFDTDRVLRRTGCAFTGRWQEAGIALPGLIAPPRRGGASARAGRVAGGDDGERANRDLARQPHGWGIVRSENRVGRPLRQPHRVPFVSAGPVRRAHPRRRHPRAAGGDGGDPG